MSGVTTFAGRYSTYAAAFEKDFLTGPVIFKKEEVKVVTSSSAQRIKANEATSSQSSPAPVLKAVVDRSLLKTKKNGVLPDNSAVRKLYSQMQLLRIELESELKGKGVGDFKDTKEYDEMKKDFEDKIEKLNAMSESLKIERKKKGWLMFIDNTLRFFCFAAWLMISSSVLSPISIFFKPIDDILAKYKLIAPQFKLSTLIKRLVGYVTCVVAGVQLISEGLEDEHGKPVFGQQSYVMCFSHASNLDAFALAATTPIFHPCPGKADLFFIPFFSWILYACGVIPIHRTDQEQSFRVLEKVGNDVVHSGSGDCVAISPEGTRSKSGMILDFKSGPFYQAEAVNLPAIPAVLVGASDLWPASGCYVNASGKVYVRYLKPIKQTVDGKKIDSSDEVARKNNRNRLSKEVRVSMLTSLLDTPSDKDISIDFSFRIQMYIFHAIVIYMSYSMWKFLKYLLFERLQLSTIAATGVLVLTPLLLTAALFLFITMQIKMMKPTTTKDIKKVN